MRIGRVPAKEPKLLYLPPQKIQPNPAQPRKHFDPEGLRELAASIRCCGILQPLTVRRVGSSFELVAGERRLRAAKLAGCSEVPCLLLTVDEERSGIIALVENLQRRDLDYIEEAEGLLQLMRRYGLRQEEAAARIGKSQSAVANKLRLLRLGAPLLAQLREQHLSERHARALLKLPTEEERRAVLSVVVQQQLNVAKTEEYIEAWLKKNQAAPQNNEAIPPSTETASQFAKAPPQALETALQRSEAPPQSLAAPPPGSELSPQTPEPKPPKPTAPPAPAPSPKSSHQRELQSLLKSIDRSLEQALAAGLVTDTLREETETEIILTLRLPKESNVLPSA